MKYKVGDKVRIKSLDWYGKYANKNGIIVCGNYYFTQNMLKYCGKVLMITNVIRDFYVCKDIDYQFSDEMIEGLAEEPIILNGKEVMLKLADIELPSGTTNIWKCPEGYIFKDEHGNVINTTKIVLEKQKKEYPKTYEECLKVLGYGDSKFHCIFHTRADERLFEALYRLKVCRDTYWKIAGEEMGLGKPWEPDWKNSEMKYTISFEEDEYTPYRTFSVNCPVAFPTEEMRDAFYENFKEEIENCKELL